MYVCGSFITGESRSTDLLHVADVNVDTTGDNVLANVSTDPDRLVSLSYHVQVQCRFKSSENLSLLFNFMSCEKYITADLG